MYVSQSAKEPEKLAKWLSFMTSTEGMTLGNFGIEGVQYTKDDKGLITRTEKGAQDQKDSSKRDWISSGNSPILHSLKRVTGSNEEGRRRRID